jgi:hypothetical protein
VLHGIPTNATYEETLEALGDRYGDQHFDTAFHSQLISTQIAGESLQEFATAREQLAHGAYPTLPKELIRRDAGKAFADGVENPDSNFQQYPYHCGRAYRSVDWKRVAPPRSSVVACVLCGR